MVHTTSGTKFITRLGSVGCLAKRITYKGLASHAGASPWAGKNALYAATCGINACNALRETFKEADVIRFHPIITNGGDIVNAIPETVTIESFVRGMTFDAIKDANKRINQALCGSALSLGNNIEIVDKAGYGPLTNDPNMIELTKDAVAFALPNEQIHCANVYGSGSSDMGDLSCLFPSVHPYAPGATGKCHGNDYQIENKDLACLGSAKLQLGMLYLLLKDNAERAKTIIKNFTPLFKNKQEYFNFISELESEGDRITYLEDRTALVKL